MSVTLLYPTACIMILLLFLPLPEELDCLFEKSGSFSEEYCLFLGWSSFTVQELQNKFLSTCAIMKLTSGSKQSGFFCDLSQRSPSDGVGGTVKCLAARASLQRPYERQIMTPLQLLLKVYQEYCSTEEEVKDHSQKRFENSHNSWNTYFIPISRYTLKVRAST